MENLYRNSIPRLLIIVPCYNEEEVLSETINRLAEQISLLRQQQLISVGNILLVDDGSTDGTWQIIELYAQQKREVAGLKLVHNSGHQQALWAGLEYAADRVFGKTPSKKPSKISTQWNDKAHPSRPSFATTFGYHAA